MSWISSTRPASLRGSPCTVIQFPRFVADSGNFGDFRGGDSQKLCRTYAIFGLGPKICSKITIFPVGELEILVFFTSVVEDPGEFLIPQHSFLCLEKMSIF